MRAQRNTVGSIELCDTLHSLQSSVNYKESVVLGVSLAQRSGGFGSNLRPRWTSSQQWGATMVRLSLGLGVNGYNDP